MQPALKIAVAGLGTVGAATVQLLERQAEPVGLRAGRRIVVVAVSARDRRRDRGVDLSAVRWYEDAAAMAADPEVDAVVELIGGADGIALDVVETALARGKHVVTANKALIAKHGLRLARRAEEAGVALAFEAAVAGGIPIIKTLRESLAGNRVSRIYGILNGTSNYILTTMRQSGREFAEVLAEAQKLGYAEADPSFDIDGVDAAHKLAILASLAFGRPVDADGVYTEGIRHVSRLDIDFADELGFRIKLLGDRPADRARARTARSSVHGAGAEPRSPRSRGYSTRSSPRAISSAASCSKGAAPAPSRPPRRSPPTSSISRPDAMSRRSGCRRRRCARCRRRRWSVIRAPITCG